jgi:hypothetical protein
MTLANPPEGKVNVRGAARRGNDPAGGVSRSGAHSLVRPTGEPDHPRGCSELEGELREAQAGAASWSRKAPWAPNAVRPSNGPCGPGHNALGQAYLNA